MRRGILTNRRQRSEGASIDIAPLIDMVFILLIFYIVSTSFVQDAGVAIDRPQSSSAQPVTTRYLPVAITKSGSVHVAGQQVSAEDVSAIRQALDNADVSRVIIQADKGVPTGLLLEVYDTCAEAGAKSIDVAAIAE